MYRLAAAGEPGVAAAGSGLYAPVGVLVSARRGAGAQPDRRLVALELARLHRTDPADQN